nr:MAG TPA: hypothetical protein [Caudoviricetes sp.]
MYYFIYVFMCKICMTRDAKFASQHGILIRTHPSAFCR